MIRLMAVVILFASAFQVRAQMPDLDASHEVWRGSIEGRNMRVCQIPKQATALIPLRFVLQDLGDNGKSHNHPNLKKCPQCTGDNSSQQGGDTRPDIFDAFSHAEFKAVDGSEALLSYASTRTELHGWGGDLTEVRETFRSPGKYQLTFCTDTGSSAKIDLIIDVNSYRYLNFGEEFTFFVLGCILLGLVLIGIILWLHRRMPPNRATQQAT